MTKRSLFFFFFFAVITTAKASMLPERIALVDTGYDACIASRQANCKQNKNLLFRGNQPLPESTPFIFDFDDFRKNIFSYIEKFNLSYYTNAALPSNLEDLKNYRIVVVNLLYDFYANGSPSELDELEYEFKDSGAVTIEQLPEQHKLYGLNSPFHSDRYAFLWWPVILSNIDDSDPNFISLSLNWPDKLDMPAHTFKPDVYLPLNLSYFISGDSFTESESDRPNLHTLLSTIPVDGHPLLIYFHCVAGKDRTGAVSQAYFMKHGGYPYLANILPIKHYRSGLLSFQDALAATSIPDHLPSPESKKLALAFCKSLNKPGYCTSI